MAEYVYRKPLKYSILLIKIHLIHTGSSVIFVHGLQGHPERTWTTRARLVTRMAGLKRKWPFRNDKEKVQSSSPLEVETVGPVFWPKELLPDDLPNARILSYGYNSTVTNFFSFESINQNSIYQHAKDMLMEIIAIREDGKLTRPIVFLAHSLGGIIVKEVSCF